MNCSASTRRASRSCARPAWPRPSTAYSLHIRTTGAFWGGGIHRGDPATLADIARLPVTTKADYMADPQSFGWVPKESPTMMRRSSGDVMYTTVLWGADPVRVDRLRLRQHSRAQPQHARLRGVRGEDSILNLFPLTKYPHGAFPRVLHAAAACNIPVVSAMPGRANPRRPELSHEPRRGGRNRGARTTHDPVGASYIRRMIGRAEEITRAAVRAPGVRDRGGARRGGAQRSDRQAQRPGAPDPRVSVSYGATEMQGGMVEARTAPAITIPRPTSSCSRRSIRRRTRQCRTMMRASFC